jgi:FimV-like protein
MRNGFRFLVTAILLLASAGVHALGLGQPSVKSFLNQPLEVEIELIAVSPAEAESVTARLATLQDYQRVGIGQLRLSVPLSFSVFATANRAFILIESTEPVRDPVIQLLLDVNWSRGRLLKEYTLFLDPATVPVAPPRITSPPPVRTVEPEPEPEPAPVYQESIEPETELPAEPGIAVPEPVADSAAAVEDTPELESAPVETTVAEAEVEEPPAQEPAAPEPATAEPIVEDPPAEEPFVAETAVAEPEGDDTPVEEPVVDKLPDAEPVVDDTTIEAAAIPEQAAEQPAEEIPASVPEPEPEPELTPEVENEPALQERPVARAVSAGANHGPVQSGETLWRIAKDWVEGSEYSVNQAMITIALANPRAFRNGNINRLQQGVVLRLPEGWEMASISRTEASRRVTEHADAWRRGVPLPPAAPIFSEAGADFERPADAEPATEPAAESVAAEIEGDEIHAEEVEPEAVSEPEPAIAEPGLPQPRLELLATEIESGTEGGSDSAREQEQRAQLQLVQELLQQAEARMRTRPADKEALAAEIDDLRATVLELRRALNLDDKDLAALAARSREDRTDSQGAGSQSLDDLLAEARQGESRADSDGTTAEADEQLPWYEQGWFIAILGLVLFIGFVYLLRRGASGGAGNYGERSLVDALIEDEEEHVDYSAADVPGVEPDNFGDDLSALTEEAEQILKSLEQESRKQPAQNPESIYEGITEDEDTTVGIDGTTVSTIEMDEDELAQFLAEHRPEPTVPESDDSDADDDVVLPDDEDDMESRLDLAIAYLGSEDGDKARKLLEEVLENGDDQQRLTALKLLDKL